MEGIGVGLVAVLVVIALAELALVIWALVDIARRPRTSALPRWAWVLLVIFFNLIGPVAYLLVGRKDQPVLDEWNARPAGPGQPSLAAPTMQGAAPRGTASVQGAAAPGTVLGAAALDESAAAEPASDETLPLDLPADPTSIPEAPAAPEPPAAQPSRTERAIDTLYGTEQSEE